MSKRMKDAMMKEKSELTFFLEQDKWLIKINSEGIQLNREEYPNFSLDEFSEGFIKILDKYFKTEDVNDSIQ